ncbi:DUF4149 domain-containing protein [Marinicauda algicola]|uniref:DUF4149 domain-containing protein n=1 Tax=Marinicauda algicola TaxID=2029849 RepID=A0A4S2H0Y5_9PROT|nr:DUF4149 domain-containing protein [Marinicauda algicola]TGY89175.1 DUF4149 domain-containing protein [Marinicauda algicola]
MFAQLAESLPAILAFLSIGGGIATMIFFAAIVTPTAFQTLGEDQAGPFVRALFPLYYLFFLILAALATLFTLLAGAEIAAILLAVVTGGFAYGRFLLMPEIERAREAGEVERRRRLHRRSVLINTIQLAGFLVALLLLAGRV